MQNKYKSRKARTYKKQAAVCAILTKSQPLQLPAFSVFSLFHFSVLPRRLEEISCIKLHICLKRIS